MRILLFSFVFFFSTSNVQGGAKLETPPEKSNPFSPTAALIRYWNSHIFNDLPKPSFLLSKASPLTAVDAAKLAALASRNSLSSHLDLFCSSAHLFCAFDNSELTDANISRTRDADFTVYSGKSFAGYGSARIGGADSFKNYSDGLNTPDDSFKRYSRGSTGHSEGFASYATDGNVASDNFTGYGAASTGGSGDFSNYQNRVNVPTLRFTSYDSDANNHKLSFSTYSEDTNSGSQAFASYGKKGNDGPTGFTSYSKGANMVGSSFTGYGESGNGANDSFTSYGNSGNNPHSDFKLYGLNGNLVTNSFSNYRDDTNVGEDSFQSYGRNSNTGKINFVDYGKTFNIGNDTFKEYGKGHTLRTTVSFTVYGMDRNFKDYSNKGVTFAGYRNESGSGSLVNTNRWVEAGKFFRETMLKEGNVILMPDIRDKMPARSFLPRAISSKLPFSTSEISKLREIFHVPEESGAERVLMNALRECERTPSRGETKRCVGSMEDMIDFATSVLGRNVVVRTTADVEGSRKRVLVGKVKGINGGAVTKSVSCHQSLYPYLLYYCHSVPEVRVYEAEILDLGPVFQKVNPKNVFALIQKEGGLGGSRVKRFWPGQVAGRTGFRAYARHFPQLPLFPQQPKHGQQSDAFFLSAFKLHFHGSVSCSLASISSTFCLWSCISQIQLDWSVNGEPRSVVHHLRPPRSPGPRAILLTQGWVQLNVWPPSANLVN